MESCPCGASQPYSECCEPFILGVNPVPTAEALMRSRYTAYTRCEVDYILRTTHPNQRNQDSETNLRQWAQKSVWHELNILNIVGGGSEDPAGTVEFIAEYTENNKRVSHHELAEFKKENGTWFFWDGGPPKPKQFIRPTPKTGRNDPCSCGSGKKFKKCCG
jgi:SEC-C motif-containing protein